jgi:O-antigen/teichoic acid export membrane protein
MISVVVRERWEQYRIVFLNLLVSWGQKAGFTLIDQALFAGSNFVLSLLLARWMSTEGFGAFYVIYSIFLLTASLHTAILSEPLLVIGSTKYEKNLSNYLGVTVLIHFILTFVVSISIGAIALFSPLSHSFETANALLGMSIALPFILFQWLMRRACYTVMKPMLAAVGSALYLTILFFGIFFGYHIGLFTPLFVWCILGFAGLIVSLWLLWILKLDISFHLKKETFNGIIRDNWHFGSWNLLGTGINWFSGQVILVLVPICLGLNTSAKASAALNFFSPLNSLMQSVSILMLPTFSRAFVNHNLYELRKKALLFSIPLAGGFLLYGLFVSMFSDNISRIIYNGKYSGLSPIVLLFTFSYTASAFVSVFTVVIKSVKMVRFTSYVWGISAVVSTIFTIPMIKFFGLRGAIMTLAVSYIIAAIMAWIRIQKITSN